MKQFIPKVTAVIAVLTLFFVVTIVFQEMGILPILPEAQQVTANEENPLMGKAQYVALGIIVVLLARAIWLETPSFKKG